MSLSIFKHIVKNTNDVHFLQSYILGIGKELVIVSKELIFNVYIYLSDINITKVNKHYEKSRY